MNVRTVPALEISHADHAALWTEAFSDYFTPGVFTAESLAAFEKAFDLDRSASRIVLEDDRPVAFAMLGIREASRAAGYPANSGPAPGAGGPLTRGWVGGMGVIPAARRRGHGERVMAGILEAARERRLSSVRLEVLVQNVAAIPLYEALGFRTLRRLEVWERPAAGDPAKPGPAPVAPDPATREISIDEAADSLGPAALEAMPWQRELAAVRRAFPDLAALAAEDSGARAVLVHRTVPERVGLVAIGCRGDADAPESIGRALDRLLASFLATRSDRPVRLLNLSDDDPAAGALARAGFAVSHRQWEMELELI